MKVNFNVDILDIAGNPVKTPDGQGMKIKEALANSIVQSRAEGNYMALFELAQKIYRSEAEEDYTPFEIEIIERVLETSGIWVLAAAQVKNIILKNK